MMFFRTWMRTVVVLTLALGLAAAGYWLTGCASTQRTPTTEDAQAGVLTFPGSLDEIPVPEGEWRGHQLGDCAVDLDVPVKVENLLGTCSQFFREGSGSDGMIELEMALDAGTKHSLIDLTLGQLYLLAGQGEPSLLPVEGPAKDVGDWEKNKIRLLARSRSLLQRAARERPDDAVVDFLLADASRAAGDLALASEYTDRAMEKCTGGRSIGILRLYQQLNRYPARYLGGASPQYPADALANDVSGDVTIDLLLDPAGKVRQGLAVASPSSSLSQAAFESLREGKFESARVGKYPVWSWLRVTISFNLAK